MKVALNITDSSCRQWPVFDQKDPLFGAGLTQEMIQRETPLLSVTYPLAREYGGPITRAVLRSIAIRTAEIYDARIDVRRTRLRPGDTPSVYGTRWHCDFPLRGGGGTYAFDRERDLQTHNYLFISGEPRTEFIAGDEFWLEFAQAPNTIQIDKWLCVHPRSTELLEPGSVRVYNPTHVHRSRPWTGAAPIWRYMFRATYFLPDDPECIFENRVGEQTGSLRRPL